MNCFSVSNPLSFALPRKPLILSLVIPVAVCIRAICLIPLLYVFTTCISSVSFSFVILFHLFPFSFLAQRIVVLYNHLPICRLIFQSIALFVLLLLSSVPVLVFCCSYFHQSLHPHLEHSLFGRIVSSYCLMVVPFGIENWFPVPQLLQ